MKRTVIVWGIVTIWWSGPLGATWAAVLAAAVVGWAATTWWCATSGHLRQWAHAHAAVATAAATVVRIICTRATWRDWRRMTAAAAARRRVRGTAAELLACVDDPRGKRRALQLLQRWVVAGAPIGTSEPIVVNGTPRSVRTLRETATGVEAVVVMPPRAGAAKTIASWAAGIESQAGMPHGCLHITPIDGQPPHVLLFRFTLRGAPKPEAVQPKGDETISDGVVLGLGVDGVPVRVPVVGVFWWLAASPNAGKTTTLTVAAEQVAACRDAHLWVVDATGGVPRLRDIAERYVDNHDDALAVIDDVWAEVERRRAHRVAQGLLELAPSPEWPHLWVIVDESPDLFAAAGKQRTALEERWTRLVRVSRKEGVTVAFAAQKATKDALATGITSACTVRILQTMSLIESRLMLGHLHVDHHVDASVLRPKTGEAIAVLPGATEAVRLTIARPGGAPTRPSGRVSAPPSAPPSADASDTAPTCPDEGGTWAPPTPGADRRSAVLAALARADQPLTLTGLARAVLGDSGRRNTLRPTVEQLAADGLIERASTGWAIRHPQADAA